MVMVCSPHKRWQPCRYQGRKLTSEADRKMTEVDSSVFNCSSAFYDMSCLCDAKNGIARYRQDKIIARPSKQFLALMPCQMGSWSSPMYVVYYLWCKPMQCAHQGCPRQFLSLDCWSGALLVIMAVLSGWPHATCSACRASRPKFEILLQWICEDFVGSRRVLQNGIKPFQIIQSFQFRVVSTPFLRSRLW